MVNDEDPQSSWNINEDKDPNPWLMLTFNKTYNIKRVDIMHRPTHLPNEMFKNIAIKFSDGKLLDFTLMNNPDLNRFIIPNDTKSSFVNISGRKSFGHKFYNTGFSTVRVYGCFSGIYDSSKHILFKNSI